MRSAHLIFCCLTVVSLKFQCGEEPATARCAAGLEPPAAVIRSPAEDETVGPESYSSPGDPQAAPVFGVVVAASVSWPDGRPRSIRRATLLVDGAPQSVLTDPPDSLTFVWNPDGPLPTGPVTLQVVIEDEWGLTGRSDPIVVRMERGTFFCPAGSRSALCRLAPGGLLPFLAIVVALIALGLVLVHRKDAPGADGEADGAAAAFPPDAGATLRFKDRLPSVKATLSDLDGNTGIGKPSIELFGTTSIGRSRRNADLVLHPHRTESPISRLHCTVLEEDGAFFLRDEQSANGTYLNGVRLAPMERHPLKDGDLIQLAQPECNGVRMQFHARGSGGSDSGGRGAGG
jgi:hypothetical protein